MAYNTEINLFDISNFTEEDFLTEGLTTVNYLGYTGENGYMFEIHNPEEVVTFINLVNDVVNYDNRGYKYVDGAIAKFINCRRCYEIKLNKRKLGTLRLSK